MGICPHSSCYFVLSYALECYNLTNACVKLVLESDVKPIAAITDLISCQDTINFEFLYCQKKTVLHGMLYSWYVSVIRFIEDAENAEC